MNKFVLKTLISRRVSYFVGILSRVGDIFLSSCSQVFSLLNLRFRGIFELYKSPVQRRESFIYIYKSLKGTYIWVIMNIKKKNELRVVVFIF